MGKYKKLYGTLLTPTEESYLSQLSSALRNGWTGFVSGIQQLTVWV